MPSSNDPAAWQNFFLMMGTANATITGLLFVALSIHLREVLEHPRLKPRAVIALVVLTTQIVISAISLIVGVGGGFYLLALVLVLTLARTMASCWALLTALE
jgi:hypothetical protein